MSKFKVSVPCDYIIGHLRYGHNELVIEADNLEKAKEYMNTDEGYYNFIDCSELIVDDYEIDDFGDLNFEHIKIEEVK